MSGEINLDNCSTEDTVYIGSTSGDISAVNFSAQLLSVNTTSGELELDSSAVESLLCETTSGDIDFEHLRSKNIVLSTTSGEIEGSIVGNQAEYDISWSSVSGNCNLPKTSSGNICSLTVDTTSGDCYIVFES